MKLPTNGIKVSLVFLQISLLYMALLPLLSCYFLAIVLILLTLVLIISCILRGNSSDFLHMMLKFLANTWPMIIAAISGIITFYHGVRSVYGILYGLRRWYSSGEITLALLYTLTSFTSLYYVILMNTHITPIRKYVRENPGGPLIILFMLFLVTAAMELAKGSENIANRCAEVAYYYLVAGVILQLLSAIKEERKSKR
ncbi:MAG: hypothetical protein J7J99_03270 [Thermoprotei archaeon]|nr:hypothetical protein [Thermoprotei archaeon]